MFSIKNSHYLCHEINRISLTNINTLLWFGYPVNVVVKNIPKVFTGMSVTPVVIECVLHVWGNTVEDMVLVLNAASVHVDT